MTKKYLTIIAFTIIIAVLVISYLLYYAQPVVDIQCTIEPIPQKDYDRLKANGSFSGDISEYRKVTLNVDFNQPMFFIYNRKINVINLQKELADSQSFTLIGGGFTKDDELVSGRAQYTQNAEVYLKGASPEELKQYLGARDIKIRWTKLNHKVEKVYHISDYLQVK